MDAPEERRHWWLIITDQEVDLCIHHPGHEADTSIEICLRELTNLWMGRSSLADLKKQRKLKLEGQKKYVDSFDKWFLLSSFAEFSPMTI